MRYTKGESGNPQGRPKGAKNKAKARVLELIGDFLEANLPDVQQYYDELEPKEKLRFLSSLLNYVVPKQQGEPQQREQQTELKNYWVVGDKGFAAMEYLCEDGVGDDYVIPMWKYKQLKEEGKI